MLDHRRGTPPPVTSRIGTVSPVTTPEHFGPALWPDEAAWRLRLEFKRASGFSASELVTFRRVPILNAAATNTLWQTNVVGGVQFVLRKYVQEPPGHRPGLHSITTGKPKFRLEMAGRLDGVSLDFVGLTTDSGEKAEADQRTVAQLHTSKEYDDDARLAGAILWSLPPNVKTMDITWAVQKTRTVEFMVKPPQME